MIMLLTIITIHTANEKWNFLDAGRWKKIYSKVMLILLSKTTYISVYFAFYINITTMKRRMCYFLRCDNPKFHWRIVPHCSLLCINKMVWSAHSMSLQLFISNQTNTWSRVFENRIKWNSVQNNFWHDVICQEFTWSILLWFWIIGNKYVTL